MHSQPGSSLSVPCPRPPQSTSLILSRSLRLSLVWFFLGLGAVRRVKSARCLVNKLDERVSGLLPLLSLAWSSHPQAMGVGRRGSVLPSRCWLAKEGARGGLGFRQRLLGSRAGDQSTAVQ